MSRGLIYLLNVPCPSFLLMTKRSETLIQSFIQRVCIVSTLSLVNDDYSFSSSIVYCDLGYILRLMRIELMFFMSFLFSSIECIIYIIASNFYKQSSLIK